MWLPQNAKAKSVLVLWCGVLMFGFGFCFAFGIGFGTDFGYRTCGSFHWCFSLHANHAIAAQKVVVVKTSRRCRCRSMLFWYVAGFCCCVDAWMRVCVLCFVCFDKTYYFITSHLDTWLYHAGKWNSN